ncbi:MAG: HEAT repeat domain-containing protein [Prochlorotrichaceae cyanobacterium]|jgi:HEAT repeat protein
MTQDDLSILEEELELTSPLDRWEEQEPEPPPDPDTVLPLLNRETSTPQERILAARAFCQIQDERAVPLLLALLADPCPLLRVSVAYALGHNAKVEVVDPVIAQLRVDWNGYVRKGLVWALGNCGDDRGIDPLLDVLTQDIAAVRLWAASSLGQLAPVRYETILRSIPALVKVLRQDPIAVVRSNCAWAIGQICQALPANVVYATSVDALIEALVEDEDMSVREDAKSSLLKLGDSRALQMIEDLQQEGLLW